MSNLVSSVVLVPQLHWLPVAIFAVTYVFIAIESALGSHLDRTAAAFCGAVAMVLAGTVSLNAAYRAISWDTIIFLLGVMILVAHFEIAQFFDWIAARVARIARTPFQFLVLLIFTSGILAAFFVNDTICLMFTPIVLAVTERLRLAKVPYLLALATSANIGSVMSVTGNPQNALIGVTAHLTFLGFLAHLAPIALLGLALDAAVLTVFFRKQIWHAPPLEHAPETIPIVVQRALLAKSLLAALLVIVLWILNFPFPLAAAAVGAFILIIGRVKSENVYRRLNWELLLFFAALFVVMQGFENSGAVDYLIRFFAPGFRGSTEAQLFSVSGAMLALSNLVSNVPAVLLVRPVINQFANAHFLWLAVASTSTLAGNATPISSVANLIVLQQAGWKVRIRFWEFAKVGITVTIITTLTAIAVLALESRLLQHF